MFGNDVVRMSPVSVLEKLKFEADKINVGNDFTITGFLNFL